MEDTVKGQCGWRNAVNAVNAVGAAGEPLRARPRVWRLNNKRGQVWRGPERRGDGWQGGGEVWWRLVLTIISASLFVVVLVQCIDKVLRMRPPGHGDGCRGASWRPGLLTVNLIYLFMIFFTSVAF